MNEDDILERVVKLDNYNEDNKENIHDAIGQSINEGDAACFLSSSRIGGNDRGVFVKAGKVETVRKSLVSFTEYEGGI